jgi:hypothetical protein
VLVFAVLAKAIMSSSLADLMPPAKPEPTVRQIGDRLMTRYILPLEIIGLLLTAAAIGAVIIAMKDLGRGQLSGPRIKTQQPEFLPNIDSDATAKPEPKEAHS